MSKREKRLCICGLCYASDVQYYSDALAAVKAAQKQTRKEQT